MRFDDVMNWISASFLVIVAVIFERRGVAHNWFTAAAWSMVALLPPITLNRKNWGSWNFWRRWILCSLIHCAAMGVLFGVLIPQTLKIGSVVMFPAVLEGLVISFWAGGKWVRPHAARRTETGAIR